MYAVESLNLIHLDLLTVIKHNNDCLLGDNAQRNVIMAFCVLEHLFRFCLGSVV